MEEINELSTFEQIKENIAKGTRKKTDVDSLIEYLTGQLEWLQCNKEAVKTVDKTE